MSRWRTLRGTAVLAVFLLPVGCGQGQAEGGEAEDAPGSGQVEASPTYKDITVEELQAIVAERDPFLVNVHIPFEGDLPGTDGSIRFDEIAQHLDELPSDKDAEIILYCRSGRMSEESATVLTSLGYTNVSNLVGGFRAWEAAGLEVIRAPSP
jgi:rhodanese-related sulfurtransferase